MVTNVERASEVEVQGNSVSRQSVERILMDMGDVPPLRNASFHVLREDGSPISAKEVIYAVTDRAPHSGNQAAQALLKLGFTVHVRRRAPAHGKPPYAKFVEAGLLVFDNESVAPPDPPEIIQLKRQLEELQSVGPPQVPEALRRIQRVLKVYERPSSITRYVKRTRGATCRLCGELGFVKRNGKRYCEVHHLFHLSKNPPPNCLSPEYLVVLCATCHRRMHYADVGEPVREGDAWRVRVDDSDYRF